jgi:hypothetical protein
MPWQTNPFHTQQQYRIRNQFGIRGKLTAAFIVRFERHMEAMAETTGLPSSADLGDFGPDKKERTIE